MYKFLVLKASRNAFYPESVASLQAKIRTKKLFDFLIYRLFRTNNLLENGLFRLLFLRPSAAGKSAIWGQIF